MQSARAALARGAKRAPSRLWLRGDGSSLVHVLDWHTDSPLSNKCLMAPTSGISRVGVECTRGRQSVRAIQHRRLGQAHDEDFG